MYTERGRWRHGGEAWTHWCDGFLPGMLWIIAAREPGDAEGDWWMKQAERYSRPLEPRQYDREVHDLGFIFTSTYKRWFDLTDDAQLKSCWCKPGAPWVCDFARRAHICVHSLSEDSLFIDIMMNVGIIFYAARETSNAGCLDIAMRHR